MNKEELHKEFEEWKKNHFGAGEDIDGFPPDEFDCIVDEFMIPKIKEQTQDIKERVADILEKNEGNFLSGNRIKTILKMLDE